MILKYDLGEQFNNLTTITVALRKKFCSDWFSIIPFFKQHCKQDLHPGYNNA